MKQCWKKAVSAVLCGVLLLSAVCDFLPANPVTVFAEEGGEQVAGSDSNESLYQAMTGDQKPDGFESLEENPKAIDPYGYGIDVPFYLNKQDELVVYKTKDLDTDPGTQRNIQSYNLATGIKLGDPLKGAQNGTTYPIPMAGGSQEKELNYVKMVAFDPNGTGREDHLAVIGVHSEETDKPYGGRKDLYLYVYSKDGSAHSSYLNLGRMDWIGDYMMNSSATVNAGNFLGITAGDYDGDGLDTLVVWGCFDSTGYGLREIKAAESGSGSQTKISLTPTGRATQELLHDEYRMAGGLLTEGIDYAGLFTLYYAENKLCAAVDTGDVNGDRIDDLVVLSFVNLMNEDGGLDHRTQMYRPYLAVSYGGKNVGDILAKKDVTAEVCKKNGTEGKYDKWLTCIGANLSVGDINGDGQNEIVVAGIKNEVRGNINVNADDPYAGLTGDKAVIAAFRCSTGQTVAAPLLFQEVEANAWTVKGLLINGQYGDHCFPQYSVQCVAINGKGNPEMIFVNGDLYAYGTDNGLGKVYEGPTFKTGHSDSEMVRYRTAFLSAAVGNFDGNDNGHEQVVYTFGYSHGSNAQRQDEDCTLSIGMVGGDFSEETTESGLAKSYYSTSASYYQQGGAKLEGEAYAYCNKGFAYCVCAIDNDEDGLVARYHEKGYTYTDPEILAVLQAAPQYKELRNYGASYQTTYKITQSSSYEDTDSKSVSFGAGVQVGFEAGSDVSPVEAEFEARIGGAMNWCEEFTESFSQSTTYEFYSTNEDAVVLYRTPVTLYCYQVKTAGSWSDDSIVLSFPGKPSHTTISVNRYNEFAEYYNEQNRKKMKENGKSEDEAPTLALLKDTDQARYYLDTGGDPTKYMNANALSADVAILQPKANSFSVETGGSGAEHYEEHSTGSSTTNERGFSFEVSLKLKFGVPLVEKMTAGAYASLEYMNGHTHTSTKSEGKGFSCQIINAERTTMKEAGFSDAACDSYGYNYQMAAWTSPIDIMSQGKAVGKVPIYGFVVSNANRPSYAELHAPQTLTLRKGYAATTSSAFRVYGDPIPTVTKVSGNDKITYNAITRKLEVAPGLAIGTYPVVLKADNGIPGKEAICEFTVQVEMADYSESGIIASVTEMISNLPAKVDLLLSDEVYVLQANRAYNALTDEQKAKIPENLKSKLANCMSWIQEFKDEAGIVDAMITADVPEIREQIADLAEVLKNEPLAQEALAGAALEDGETLAGFNKEDVEAVIRYLSASLTGISDSYNALSNEQKSLVSDNSTKILKQAQDELATVMDTYDKTQMSPEELKEISYKNTTAANSVANLIKLIGNVGTIDVNTSDEEAFEAQYQKALESAQQARKAYEALTMQQKALVGNADELTAAEKALGTLATERRNVETQQQADTTYMQAIEKIESLPATVTLADEQAVQEARFVYDGLSAENKTKVPASILARLTAAEEKIVELKNGTKVTGITITGVSQKIAAGKKVALTAKVAPANATNKTLKWTTSNKNYATVTQSGVVTTNAKAGGKKVTITAAATDGSGIKATYVIAIGASAVESVTLSGISQKIVAGKSLTLTAKVLPATATNPALKWSTSSTKLATVTQKGVVTIKANTAGKKVAIYAETTDGTAIKAKYIIEIGKTPVSTVKLTGISQKIALGGKFTLSAAIAPSGAFNKTLKWTTSNKNLATVTQKGLVTVTTNAKAAGKKVKITASATDGSGVVGTFTFQIMKGAVKSITITGAKTKLAAGKSMQLKATPKATAGANTALKWTSSNTKYATVTAKGVVKALKAGKGKKVTITATATDGTGVKKAITFTVA